MLRTMVDMFGAHPKASFKEKNLLPAVKHSDGNVMIWNRFSASWTGQLGVIDSTVKSASYQNASNSFSLGIDTFC